MKPARQEIQVVGAGIIGMSTAILFACLGFDTTIIAEETPLDRKRRQGELLPTTSSFFPAASVIPHSMNYNKEIIDRIFTPSQHVWNLLAATSVFGVRVAKNIEVFCDLKEERIIPPYVQHMAINELTLPDSALTKAIQDVFPESRLTGYGYSYFLAQMDWYAPMLSRLFGALGGKIETRRLNPEELQQSKTPTVVAAGIGSDALTQQTGGKQLAGHLILLDVSHDLQSRAAKLMLNSEYESYDLLPPKNVYNFKSGGEEIQGDFYAYLRTTGSWVLGGSRIPCEFKSEANWEPDFSGVEKISMPRRGFPGQQLNVPLPIWEMNMAILSRFLNVNIEDHIENREAALGLRYLTDLPQVGTEVKRESQAPCIAYYGFGGSGVTCSWGVALDALSKMTKEIGYKAPTYRLSEIVSSSGEFQLVVRLLQNTILNTL